MLDRPNTKSCSKELPPPPVLITLAFALLAFLFMANNGFQDIEGVASPSPTAPPTTNVSPAVTTIPSQSPSPTPPTSSPETTMAPEPSPRYYKPEGSRTQYYLPTEEEFRTKFTKDSPHEKPYWPPYPWKPLATVPPDAASPPPGPMNTGRSVYITPAAIARNRIVDSNTSIVRYPHPGYLDYTCSSTLKAAAIQYAKLRDFEYARHLCDFSCPAPWHGRPAGCHKEVTSIQKKYNYTAYFEMVVENARDSVLFDGFAPIYYPRYGENKTLDFCLPKGTRRPIIVNIIQLQGCVNDVARYVEDRGNVSHAVELCGLIRTEGERLNETVFSRIPDLEYDEIEFIQKKLQIDLHNDNAECLYRLVKPHYEKYGKNNTLTMCLPEGTERPIYSVFSQLEECVRTVAQYSPASQIEETCRIILTEGRRFNEVYFSKITNLDNSEIKIIEDYENRLKIKYDYCVKEASRGRGR